MRGRDGQPTTGAVERPTVLLGRRLSTTTGPNGQSRSTYRDVAYLYVATPELLAYLGLDDRVVRADTEVLTPHSGVLRYVNVTKRIAPSLAEALKIESIDAPRYSSAPNSLLTPEALRRRGWVPAPVGWLVETPAPLTDAELTRAREVAVAAGLTVETREGQAGLETTRSGATGAGVLLALGILAMTVGLIRGEAGGDLRTLTAAGATSTLRRTLTATTAGALALLGALLGIAGAYTALIAGYLDRLSRLDSIPLRQLTATAVGLPVAAAVAAWVLAGREPRSVTHQPLLE